MSGQTCTYTSGGTTVSAYCQDGCCSDGCCSDSDTDASTVAIIIACVVGGLLLLLLIALLIWCVLRYHNRNRDKKKLIKKDKGDKLNKLESGKNKKKTTVETYRVRGKKNKTFKKETETSSDGRNKNTQTINHRGQPGDVILVSRGVFYPSDGSYKYDQYINSKLTSEVGVGTDHRDVPLWEKKPKKRWNSTANYYTRRDSLKGSSEDDENMSTFKSGEGRSREVMAVNAYGYAARDTARTDYVLKKEEKTKAVVEAWKTVQTPWQPATKGKATQPKEKEKEQSKAAKKWKDSMNFVASNKGNAPVATTMTPMSGSPAPTVSTAINNYVQNPLKDDKQTTPPPTKEAAASNPAGTAPAKTTPPPSKAATPPKSNKAWQS